MSPRQARFSRKTDETQVEVTIDLDCAPGPSVVQTINVSTGIDFLDPLRHHWISFVCVNHKYVYRFGQAQRNVLNYEIHGRSLD
jgi:imidazoleglycerol phosphate dehydratase HisB